MATAYLQSKACTRWAVSAVVALSAGCVVHSDYFSKFEASGTVLNRDTREPIEGARLLFVDSGLDYVMSKQNYERDVAVTDAQGSLDAEFDYSWGTNTISIGTGLDSDPATYSLLVVHENYRPVRFDFVLDSTQVTQVLDLGEVLLIPEISDAKSE